MSIPRPRYNNKRKRRSNSKFKQGFYIPKNPEKYRQPLDTKMNEGQYPFMRSSWENRFAMYCDNSKNIIMWSTESIAIKYLSPKDNQVHRYYCDFFFKTINGDKWLVEIKPKSQVNSPVNLAKFQAAEEYCKRINANFMVVTEVELKKWKLI